MKAIIHVNKHVNQDSDNFELIIAFLRQQGNNYRTEFTDKKSILEMTNGSSMEYAVEVNGVYFHDPIALILHCNTLGLLRI